jgi:two-component system, NtrC family, response regulator GlrR
MDAEKIKACLVSFSDAPSALKNLKQIIPSCTDPPVMMSQVFPGLSNRIEIQETVKAINRLKPKLVLTVLSHSHLKQAVLFINSLQEKGLRPDILAFLEDPTSDATIDLLKLGIADVVFPPFAEENVIPRIWRTLNSSKGPDENLGSLKEKLGLRKLIGRNAAFLAEVNKIPLIARCDTNVLIAGETGTGKEIFARCIHYLGRRAPKPFVAVSCGAIPTDLFENELFGHERCAFTGAMKAQTGLIQEAEGGSLFLDDIDCIPSRVQMKVLRFLQEKEYRPLGSARTRHSDTRIIASTNTDLSKAVSQDVFRRDLFYRLNVISATLPPLRERLEDVPLLARHFIDKHGDELDRAVKDISPSALQKLMSYDWPGNVRELENVIERAVVFSTESLIDVEDIYLPEGEACLDAKSFKEAKSKIVSLFEKKYIQDLLSVHQGNISRSAKAAQKNRRAFWELIRKHKIDPRSYKSTAF